MSGAADAWAAGLAAALAAGPSCAAMGTMALARLHPKEFRAYKHMLSACYSQKDRDYPYVGGRGIRVCSAWRGPGGFSAFVRDVGVATDRALVRRNKAGHYEPGNVVWAAPQAFVDVSRRNAVLIEIRGERLPMVRWAERVGLPRQRIRGRIAHGWDPRVAVLAPAGWAKAEAHARLEGML